MSLNLLLLSQITSRPFNLLKPTVIWNIRGRVDWSAINKDTIIVFGGGTDVNPDMYGEPRGRHTSLPDVRRDIQEAQIFHAFKGKVAGFVGICRGAQLLTVLNGGKLVQHVEGHAGPDHGVMMTDTKYINYFETNSLHHQMMLPFNLPKDDYKILGYSAIPRSRGTGYWNGWNRVIPDVECEPEIVWYPKTKSLCIQGHPEYLEERHTFSNLTRSLITTLILSGV